MTRRDTSERADRLRTLLVFGVLQAFLLTVNLHLLPMSAGEAGTLNTAALPVSTDNQAPFYFLLAHGWLRLTGAGDPLRSLRLLSALFTICSTILLERLWLRKVATEPRQWVLLLWTFSPALLLFGRMAQPYSLQVLLTIIAIWSVLRFVEESGSWKLLAALAASLTALLYSDYLPGLAVWAGADVLILGWIFGSARADRYPLFARTCLLPNLLVGADFIPWMVTLAPAPRDLYSLTGNAFLESALKLAYGFYSLAFGEAIPIWLLALSALLAAPYLWVLARMARKHRQWLLPAATMALAGYIGVAHWVSYPFMGARLLFLFPLLLVAVATGIGESGRIGTVFGVALFAANAGGVWYYFEARDIVNIAYVAPQRQVAANIIVRSLPADTVVCVDGLNVDDAVLTYYLPASFAVRVLRSQSDADAAWTGLQGNPSIRHVWFIGNSISPDHAFEQLEQRMMGSWHYHALHPFVPTSETYRLALRFVMHVAQPPRYIYQVWEFRR